MSKLASEALEPTYAAASIFVDRGLRHDDSLFTPGKPVWTMTSVNDLHDRFVAKPDESNDDFMTKWKRQLAGAPLETAQFAAELLYVHLLAGNSTGRARKEEIIREVLSWTGQSITIPPDLVSGLESGYAAEGTAWRTMRWAMLGYLVRFLQAFKGLPPDKREATLRDPWCFKKIAGSVDATRAHSQREMLLHLVHPESFEPIMSGDVKEQIANRLTEKNGLARDGDVDRDLLELRRRLEPTCGIGFSFYRDDLRNQWDASRLSAGGKGAIHQQAGTLGGTQHWKIAPGAGAKYWKLWRDSSCISIGWPDLGDVGAMSPEEFEAAKNKAKEIRKGWKDAGLNQVWKFAHEMQIGDRVVANHGFSKVIGIGTVTGPYRHEPGHPHPHRREVRWDDLEPRDIDQRGWRRTLVPLTKAAFDKLLQPEASALDGLANELLISRSYLHRVVRLLEDRRQVIFYGPPGTGKTYVARKLAANVAGAEDRVTLVQFHPSYAYEDFIEGYRPTLLDNGAQGFALRPGPLMRLAERAAASPDQTFVLVIDEINRGNLAKVFGELFFLLEYRDHSINLQYSDEAFSLPPNLLMIGTMNTADRSIALLDAALRRRFFFVPFFPDQEPIEGLLRRWLELNQPEYVWLASLVDLANQRLDQPEIAIGPSYFLRDDLDETWIADIWSHAIEPYIAEHFISEPGRLADFAFERLRSEVVPSDDASGEAEGEGDTDEEDALA